MQRGRRSFGHHECKGHHIECRMNLAYIGTLLNPVLVLPVIPLSIDKCQESRGGAHNCILLTVDECSVGHDGADLKDVVRRND